MATIANGASRTITLSPGRVLLFQQAGSGVAVIGGGPGRNQQVSVGVSAETAIGPFPSQTTVYVCANGGALSYIDVAADRFSGVVADAINDWDLVEVATLYSTLPTDGTDVSVGAQADLETLYTLSGGRGGTYVLKDGATYVFQGVIIPPGITIRGENICGTFTEGSSEWDGPRLKLPTIATQPLLRNDTTRGYVRAATPTGPNANQRYAKIKLLGLALAGSRSVTDHTTACDLLRLESAWGVTIRNCTYGDSRGYGIRAIDCNTLDIDSCYGGQSPWMFDSVADSVVAKCQNGNGNGLGASVVWFANGSWKNALIGNIIYNNNSNGLASTNPRQYAFRMTVGTVSAAADTIQFSGNNVTADANHYWADETPVMLFQGAGATVPGGLSYNKTYYVKVISSNTIKLASTLRNLRDGVFVDITSAGSGSMWMTSGPEANLSFTDGCSKNEVMGGRYDQAHGAAILLDNSPRNVIAPVTVHENYFGNYTGAVGGTTHVAPTPDAAVILRNGSVGCSLSAMLIDGTKQGTLGTTTGYESRQKYGLSIDDSSRVGTVIERSVKSTNHTAAYSEAGAANFKESASNPNIWLIGKGEFVAQVGSPVIGNIVASGRRAGWLMDAATDEIISSEWGPVPGMTKFNLTVCMSNAGAGAGDVSITAMVDFFADGANMDVAPIYQATQVTTMGAQGINKLLTFTNISVNASSGLPLMIRIRRDGTAGGDTLANDIGIWGVLIEQID
jgi:hypothetical protein